MTAWTRPHSFAVPLQLFADHNLLQSPENSLGVCELQTHIFGRAASAALQGPQLRRRDAAVFSTPVYCYVELQFRSFLHSPAKHCMATTVNRPPGFCRSPFISGIPSFCARGESTDKGHLALPFICGMLPLIGGQSVTPFFQAL